ncbi:MAG: leucine--tRNA ligase [Candidatus Korarchaeota archaeon]
MGIENWDEMERKWEEEWDKFKIFEPSIDAKKPKFYIIFAYPGISGYLHVGHMRSYTYPDVIARYKRARGYNVLFPAGFHASGLPSVGFAKRVELGDPNTIETLKAHGVSDEIIEKLKDPEFVVRFFSAEYIRDWKRMGFSIDFSRVITTIDPAYNRFIEWQFIKLNELGLLTKKPHYAPYCTSCGPVAVDPSETDISRGGSAEILVYTIIKFRTEDGYVLPAATLRAETVYGVTNMWLNPDIEYVVAIVNGEKWIISQEGADKLELQNPTGFIKKTGETIKGETLIGKKCKEPIFGRQIPILPAKFVDPSVATGVVMSVPGHAPYDWVALKELQENDGALKKYNLKKTEISNIQIPSIIEAPGYGEYPAGDIVKSMDIRRQDDPKLEEATKQVYKSEYHSGVMKANCGEVAGLPVSKAKELVREKLIQSGNGFTIYDFSEEVVCRCGKKVYVKLVEGQWFIRYGDSELKKKAHECASSMVLLPREYSTSIHEVIEWYDDRACTRKGRWLGTRLIFDKEWIIEPISDSTLYPLTYLFAKFINAGKLKSEQLTPQFFDYIFLGKGKSDEIAKSTGLDEKIIKAIRDEVKYWYPLDLNCGGKEHQTVHFPVFIFNHVAVLPKEMWPRGIFVNWWVTNPMGGKMSKSKGGATHVPGITAKYSADAIRLFYSHATSPHTDVVWNEEYLETYQKRLDSLWEMILAGLANDGPENEIDIWLFSTISKRIEEITKYMDEYNLKSATIEIFYNIPSDIKWWMRRGGTNRRVFLKVVSAWARMMMPFTPHLAEEIWHRIGNETFVSTEKWPSKDEFEYVERSIIVENMIISLMEDIRELLKVLKFEPKYVALYTAPSWTWELVKLLKETNGDFNKAMKIAMEKPEIRKHGKEVAAFMKKLCEKEFFASLPSEVIDEAELLMKAQSFIQNEIGIEVRVNPPEDPAGRAQRALPGKPAVYIAPKET